MLTENQNKIISDLRDEFAKLNKTEGASTRGGLINASEIEGAINEKAKIIAEYDLMTATLLKTMKAKVKDDVDRLNQDLRILGLEAKDESNNSYAGGRIKKPSYKYDYCDIIWQYACDLKYVTLPDGTSHSYRDKLSYVYAVYSKDGDRTSGRFGSIEDMFANASIKKSLMALYQKG